VLAAIAIDVRELVLAQVLSVLGVEFGHGESPV
jgi:hypothetical protein